MDAARSILVVDDDLDICEVLEMALRSEGYHVLVARDGADALELLRTESTHPLLILLDLRMPVMNGWQFREEQLRDPRFANIPVVVMTADRPQGARAGLPGAAGVLTKPVGLEALLGTVARIANGV